MPFIFEGSFSHFPLGKTRDERLQFSVDNFALFKSYPQRFEKNLSFPRFQRLFLWITLWIMWKVLIFPNSHKCKGVPERMQKIPMESGGFRLLTR